MQSFILDRHTDPSNPTMKVTQDEKIPVYDSKAAAEADIANIVDDGIVFTKDTGATEKVVDVVEDGNMNPVTSNAVYDALRKNHFKTYVLEAESVDASGRVYTPLNATQVLPISFIPALESNVILVWQFGRYSNNVYITVNRTTGDTLTGTIYYVDL